MKSSLGELGDRLVRLRPDALGPKLRDHLSELLLDAFACAAAGHRLEPHPEFVRSVVASGGQGASSVWFGRRRIGAGQAALVNGTVAHHAEMDDGHSGASLHGGVTVVPAAVALAEATGAMGKELLLAVAAGYAAGVALGRPLKNGIEQHRLHPPGIVGCLGAAAAAARLLRLDPGEAASAISLAAALAPLGPFESFTRGAPSKDLYGGWPAFVGIRAAELARWGLHGPIDLFESERDGPGAFLLHAPVEGPFELDLEVVFDVDFKPYASCRSTHAALTAIETLLPVDARSVTSIRVETHPFACELSRDSDRETPVGAKASIPYTVASLILEGRLGPDSFTREALGNAQRRELADRVEVEVALDVGSSGSRVTVERSKGATLTAEARSPRSLREVRGKLRTLAGERAPALELAVDSLFEAENVTQLTRALM